MLALPVAELPVAGTSLEPFISALYFAFAANDDGPVITSIPAATVNARPARIIACRIAALLSKVPGTRRTASDPGLFRTWRKHARQDFCQGGRNCRPLRARTCKNRIRAAKFLTLGVGAFMARSRIALGTCLMSVLVAVPAHAQFVIKQPAVERDVLSIVGHGSYESALPDGGDPLGWGHEIEVAYGFTDFWKSELALELKQPVHEELEPSEFKFENYLELADF